MESNSKENLVWLYEYLIKQTKEKSVFDWKEERFYDEEIITKEINRLLIKYNCETIN